MDFMPDLGEEIREESPPRHRSVDSGRGTNSLAGLLRRERRSLRSPFSSQTPERMSVPASNGLSGRPKERSCERLFQQGISAPAKRRRRDSAALLTGDYCRSPQDRHSGNNRQAPCQRYDPGNGQNHQNCCNRPGGLRL